MLLLDTCHQLFDSYFIYIINLIYFYINLYVIQYQQQFETNEWNKMLCVFILFPMKLHICIYLLCTCYLN